MYCLNVSRSCWVDGWIGGGGAGRARKKVGSAGDHAVIGIAGAMWGGVGVTYINQLHPWAGGRLGFMGGGWKLASRGLASCCRETCGWQPRQCPLRCLVLAHALALATACVGGGKAGLDRRNGSSELQFGSPSLGVKALSASQPVQLRSNSRLPRLHLLPHQPPASNGRGGEARRLIWRSVAGQQQGLAAVARQQPLAVSLSRLAASTAFQSSQLFSSQDLLVQTAGRPQTSDLCGGQTQPPCRKERVGGDGGWWAGHVGQHPSATAASRACPAAPSQARPLPARAYGEQKVILGSILRQQRRETANRTESKAVHNTDLLALSAAGAPEPALAAVCTESIGDADMVSTIRFA